MSTPKNYLDCIQGSELWAELRCGDVTASRAADVIAMIEKGKNKGQEKAERSDYRTELICERLTGIPYQHVITREMQWGRDHEDAAADAYASHTGAPVARCGYVIHPTIARFGSSPDRWVGDVGLLQIKCPKTNTHLEWMMAGTIPVKHVAQMLAEFSCDPARQWCDFMSFDPRLPEHLQKFILRYHRDDKLIVGLEAEVRHFNLEIERVMQSLPQPEALELPDLEEF
jgi:hypothetical protein